MSRESLKKWTARAMAKTETRSSADPPVRVLLIEALDLAQFALTYWEPVCDPNGAVFRPGLAMVGPRLPDDVVTELLEVQAALQTIQTEYLLAVAPTQPDVRARADYLINELKQVLEWWLTDDVKSERAWQWPGCVSETFECSANMREIADELTEYASLARSQAQLVAHLGGFDLARIDEAESVAEQLRQCIDAALPAAMAEQLLGLRNRLAALLSDKMSAVRAAARFIFRDDPAILRQAASAHVHCSRAVARIAAVNSPIQPTFSASPVTALA